MTMIPVGQTPKPSDMAEDSTEVVLGLMIEGHFGWTEFCSGHGSEWLLTHPGLDRRTISLFELVNSWREYKCCICHSVLWRKPSQVKEFTS